MIAVLEAGRSVDRLPLLADADPARVLVWRGTQAVSAGEFLAQATALAARLPAAHYAVNLCQDRYQFLLSFCAAAIAGQTNLLPSSRAPQAIDEALASFPSSYALGDMPLAATPPRFFALPDRLDVETAAAMPTIAPDHVVAIAFTSGSTGVPKANPKTWRSVCASSALNAAVLGAERAPNIVATVPAQHMYGLELSILLPLCSRAAVHGGHPFFPADVALALAQIPAPRLLVTTPFHLRALVCEGTQLPALDGIVTATAPLERDLAAAAERRFATQVIEMFGSTETCVIAHRRTASDPSWQLYPNVTLQPQPDGTVVDAPHFAAPTLLQDVVELLPERRFVLRGRNSDLLEIAGKRASLGDLTKRLLTVPGVTDGVVFQLDADANGVRRLAALVVAPERQPGEILEALRAMIDPVFLPRRLRCVAALPRNAASKLPRGELLAALDA
ncbi:MAG TPA: AMP-binding protein [Rudaea sp.]